MGLTIARETGGGTRPTISLCMIMKDEEEHLGTCLASAEGVVDEIVIVDTGSTDRSVEIAESYGARVLHEPWQGDFAAPRNTSIDAATGDWILVLDADEELIDGKRLLSLVTDGDLEGYCLREVNFIGEEVGVECVVNSAFRLFRNRAEYRYEGALHEQVMGKVDPEGGVTTAFVGVEIHHYGYLDPCSDARNKTERNMQIVLDEVDRKPDDSFTLFNAGVEFQRIGDHDTAIEYFQRSFTSLPSLRAYYASLLLRNIVASLNMGERYDEALEVLSDALQAYPDFTDMHYLQGQVHSARREYRAAIRSFRRAIELGDHGGDRYLAQAGMGSFYSWHALGALYVMMGDTHEAARAFKTAITTAPGYYAAPLVALAQILLEADPADDVERYLTGLIAERRRADSLRRLAEVFLAKGHPEHALRLLGEARALSPDDPAMLLTAADCHIAAGELAAASAELERMPAGSEHRHAGWSKRVLVGVLADDLDAARQASDRLGELADGVYAFTYRAIVAAQDPAAQPPEIPAGIDRGAALDITFEFADTLLELDYLDEFNPLVALLYALAPAASDVDERLGLLLARHDFPDPAADRLLEAARAEVASPNAYGTLGLICHAKGMDEEAEAFLRAALEADDQSIGRYMELAAHLAGMGRFDDAADVLRSGLLVWPHATMLRELRDSLGMLAEASAAGL